MASASRDQFQLVRVFVAHLEALHRAIPFARIPFGISPAADGTGRQVAALVDAGTDDHHGQVAVFGLDVLELLNEF